MEPIFISRGKRFKWRARANAVLIDELDNCKYCGGTGQKGSNILSYDDDLTCPDCNHGKERWLEPYDLELEKFLQTKIEEYYATRKVLKELFHDD